jgi:bacillopeptidase F (M6 metalloprotease family)
VCSCGGARPSPPASKSTVSCAPGYKKSSKGGSTQVKVDKEAKVIYIKTCMEFGGPDATEDYAKHAKKEIEDTWSGKYKCGDEDYDVKVEVDAKTRSGDKAGSADCDQINVDKKNTRMNQTLFGAGPGNQTPAAADPKRRRIAHEYGHTLGLDDEYEDTPTGAKAKDPSKKNNIMAETWESEGKMPHPHPDHYRQVLKNYGWESACP